MDSIRDKIKKLLAVAEGNANENESANALEMAMALMMRHGIDRASLAESTEEPGFGAACPYDHKWQYDLALAAARLYGCVAVMDKDEPLFAFVGLSENRGAAQDTLVFLLSQVEAFYKANLPKGLSKSGRAQFRRHFKSMCAERVRRRIEDIIRAEKPEGSNALVVLTERARQEAASLGSMKNVEAVKRSVVVKPTAGTIMGYHSGGAVEINRSVKS